MMKQLISRMIFLALPGFGMAAEASPSLPKLDSLEQRTAACIACHGAPGRPAAQGYFPAIAGKPQGYLYQQLLNFRQGRRIHRAMNHLTAHLSDAYLREMAGYFSTQHPPSPSPQRSSASPLLLERGRVLAMQGDRARNIPACAACHGQKLAGVAPAIPGLLGLSRDYVNLQFGAWRNGVRRAAAPDCMAHIASKLAPSDVAAVSAWLAAQPVPAHYAPDSVLRGALPIRCGGVQ